jgi:hypothetical protein
MQCTVHYITTLFNVGNVLLYVIYQLNFTVLMNVTRNRGKSMNVLPVDTRALLYTYLHFPNGELKINTA